uniref:Uncharacterized protein n=1 Tax=Chromera velia CCMP2878 TaxID=1169474 RepID=A0A0G4GAQ0_9ALVE|eukprot:Cvel_21033.t1-p1 / transcript=Cvel_21033.t1 / gene=Cvel_21033 / organism=Chromera_velia_CCMP2878 / gene_product=hypothetical protein / transcript_product=hypothetical protein / location=Cvel_scaffold1940:11513-17765(+) / protein_length=598 / sequence_SO=supercontig / SO=protein_coding / is_pseudo=false
MRFEGALRDVLFLLFLSAFICWSFRLNLPAQRMRQGLQSQHAKLSTEKENGPKRAARTKLYQEPGQRIGWARMMPDGTWDLDPVEDHYWGDPDWQAPSNYTELYIQNKTEFIDWWNWLIGEYWGEDWRTFLPEDWSRKIKELEEEWYKYAEAYDDLNREMNFEQNWPDFEELVENGGVPKKDQPFDIFEERENIETEEEEAHVLAMQSDPEVRGNRSNWEVFYDQVSYQKHEYDQTPKEEETMVRRQMLTKVWLAKIAQMSDEDKVKMHKLSTRARQMDEMFVRYRQFSQEDLWYMKPQRLPMLYIVTPAGGPYCKGMENDTEHLHSFLKKVRERWGPDKLEIANITVNYRLPLLEIYVEGNYPGLMKILHARCGTLQYRLENSCKHEQDWGHVPDDFLWCYGAPGAFGLIPPWKEEAMLNEISEIVDVDRRKEGHGIPFKNDASICAATFDNLLRPFWERRIHRPIREWALEMFEKGENATDYFFVQSDHIKEEVRKRQVYADKFTAIWNDVKRRKASYYDSKGMYSINVPHRSYESESENHEGGMEIPDSFGDPGYRPHAPSVQSPDDGGGYAYSKPKEFTIRGSGSRFAFGGSFE